MFVCTCMLSHVHFFATSWTVAHKSPRSMGFSGQEYRSGLPFPSQGDFPDPGIEPACLSSSALAGEFFTYSSTVSISLFLHFLVIPIQLSITMDLPILETSYKWNCLQVSTIVSEMSLQATDNRIYKL